MDKEITTLKSKLCEKIKTISSLEKELCELKNTRTKGRLNIDSKGPRLEAMQRHSKGEMYQRQGYEQQCGQCSQLKGTRIWYKC